MKKRTILFMLRSVVTINFVTSLFILANMIESSETLDHSEPVSAVVATSTPAVSSPDVAPVAANVSTTPIRTAFFETIRQQSVARMSFVSAVRPTPEEPAAALVDATPEKASAPAPAGWTPPVWFPEGSQADLWVIDGMDAEAEHTDRPRGFRSRAAFVYDLDSGRVLLSYAADDRRPVASLTKLVAGLATVSDGADLDREVCLDRSMLPSWPGAGSRMKFGRCTQGWDLLGAALVRSDNGAALALASVSDLPLGPFVDRMNEVSRDLHMDMSTFADPSGVQDDNLSTARDMTRAVIAAAAHPVLSPVASAPYWDVEYIDGPRRRMRTTNRLLGERGMEVLAGKTGYTDTAGHCFAGVIRTASGRTLAFTTLGARRGRHRWYDVMDLISWAEQQ